MIERREQEDGGEKEKKLFEGSHWELPTDIRIVPHACGEFQKQLESAGWSEDEAIDASEGFKEALINAVAHGNLGVASPEEGKLIYEAALEEQKRLAASDGSSLKRKVEVDFSIEGNAVQVTVKDEGPGFDWKAVVDPTGAETKMRKHGRGMLLMRGFYDSVAYNEKGNEVTLRLSKRKNN